MNECVKRITDNLKPLIEDLDDKLMELDLKEDRLNNIEKFLDYVNDDVNRVGIYADQNLIIDNLDKINSNEEEYKASCYLLSSDDETVKNLPQYRNANTYIIGLIDYFKNCKGDLLSEIKLLENNCEKKKLEKKYYELLNSNSPLVEDIKEFSRFVDEHIENDEDKVNILKYVAENNLMHYESQMI